jgi:membrane associated rhomboid family serine protease
MYPTPIVRNLIILNIAMFIITSFVMPDWNRTLALHTPTAEGFRPFQFVTHFFMHGSFLHIGFNMFALLNLGPVLETNWRAERFLFYYLCCAIGAAILQCGVNLYLYSDNIDAVPPMVGASGAIFGLIVAVAYYFPNAEFQFFPIPIPIKAKYFVPLLIVVELYLGSKNSASDNVAHFAHLGGGITGFALLMFWRYR